LAADLAQARAVEEAARRAGLPVVEGFMYRHHPLYEKVFELIRGGAIGQIATIHSQFMFMLDDRSAVAASADLAGGALMDVGCYGVHLSRMIAGCEPSRVCAFERRSTVDDLLVGMMDFPNGIMAQFETGIAAAERQRARVSGTRGALVLESPWHPGLEQSRVILSRHGEPDEVHAMPGADAYALQAEAFADACLGRAPLRWPVSDAVANMAVIEALYNSAATGQVVVLP
jgi:predicted dehydrogenase